MDAIAFVELPLFEYLLHLALAVAHVQLDETDLQVLEDELGFFVVDVQHGLAVGQFFVQEEVAGQLFQHFYEFLVIPHQCHHHLAQNAIKKIRPIYDFFRHHDAIFYRY